MSEGEGEQLRRSAAPGGDPEPARRRDWQDVSGLFASQVADRAGWLAGRIGLNTGLIFRSRQPDRLPVLRLAEQRGPALGEWARRVLSPVQGFAGFLHRKFERTSSLGGRGIDMLWFARSRRRPRQPEPLDEESYQEELSGIPWEQAQPGLVNERDNGFDVAPGGPWGEPEAPEKAAATVDTAFSLFAPAAQAQRALPDPIPPQIRRTEGLARRIARRVGGAVQGRAEPVRSYAPPAPTVGSLYQRVTSSDGFPEPGVPSGEPGPGYTPGRTGAETFGRQPYTEGVPPMLEYPSRSSFRPAPLVHKPSLQMARSVAFDATVEGAQSPAFRMPEPGGRPDMPPSTLEQVPAVSPHFRGPEQVSLSPSYTSASKQQVPSAAGPAPPLATRIFRRVFAEAKPELRPAAASREATDVKQQRGTYGSAPKGMPVPRMVRARASGFAARLTDLVHRAVKPSPLVSKVEEAASRGLAASISGQPQRLAVTHEEARRTAPAGDADTSVRYGLPGMPAPGSPPAGQAVQRMPVVQRSTEGEEVMPGLPGTGLGPRQASPRLPAISFDLAPPFVRRMIERGAPASGPREFAGRFFPEAGVSMTDARAVPGGQAMRLPLAWKAATGSPGGEPSAGPGGVPPSGFQERLAAAEASYRAGAGDEPFTGGLPETGPLLPAGEDARPGPSSGRRPIQRKGYESLSPELRSPRSEDIMPLHTVPPPGVPPVTGADRVVWRAAGEELPLAVLKTSARSAGEAAPDIALDQLDQAGYEEEYRLKHEERLRKYIGELRYKKLAKEFELRRLQKSEEDEAPDLDALARQVYSIIKGMLRVEKERRALRV